MKELSPTFCIYPWIHQMTTPSGKINFCCISPRTFVQDDQGKALQLGEDSFASAWNTKYMRDMRRKMVAGEPIAGCQSCYRQEKIGKQSSRQYHNEEWLHKLGAEEFHKKVEDSKTQDFVVSSPPVYLDLRLGNLCNLKCRMCNPHNSILIEKERNELDASLDGEFSQFWKKYNSTNANMQPWYDSPKFWEEVESYIPFLKKVYMTGGEPTLIEGNYRFLETCKKLGYASQIELFFNINFMMVKDRFLEALQGFKWVNINASVDGYDQVNEYIRGNSKWSMISANLEKILAQGPKNIGLGFSPVVQIYNILDMGSLVDYIDTLAQKYDHDILVDYLFCYSPSFLDLTILPKNVKQVALQRVEEWKTTSRLYNASTPQSRFLHNGVNGLINSLRESLEREDKNKMKDFFYYTKTLDQKRNQDFATTFPELSQLLREAGYEH